MVVESPKIGFLTTALIEAESGGDRLVVKWFGQGCNDRMRGLSRSKSAFLAGLAAVTLTAIEPPANANAVVLPGRVIVSLGLLPGGTTSRATAVNDQGVIVGYGDTAGGGNHAIRWNPDGHITDLGTLPGGTYSYAYGINNRGDIVGYANNSGGNERAVRWAPNGTITDLGSLPGRTSGYAYGINDVGAVVGYIPIQSKTYHAAKWQPDGTVSDIGAESPLGSTSAAAINNHGVAVGITYEVSPGHYHEAVTWSAAGDKPTVLPPLPGGGPRSSAQSINDKGVIVGYSQSGPGAPTNYPVHAVLWGPGASAPTDLGTLPGGGDDSFANGVNAAGVVVGASATKDPGNRDAVLWRRGKNGWRIVSLPRLPGRDYSEATAINNGGEVVGEASTASGPGVAVRWE
ncbi:hypothetical protein [Actinomadura roseirufa]|uniref:hypothetical protein n=1 Tax=Actinomadura roseirufa TaxID=2094049 RepID=UPI0010419FE7|nr:hypothetical protein [Actinomadura roseirufa]